MKFLRYWAAETGTVTVDGAQKEIRCYGGSDVSEADARASAQRNIEQVQLRIDGEVEAFDDYEAAIREEIIQAVDAKNVITRTRYGALILNSENTLFVDIDKPPKRFWKSLFAWRGLSDKEKIIAHVGGLIEQPEYAHCGFRVYETHSGIRVIVSGLATDEAVTPDNMVLDCLFEDMHADPLYARLCFRQQCFRARLTPKPERVGIKRMRVEYPRDAVAQAALDVWRPDYESASARYGVCRYLREFGTPQRSRVIDLHDQFTQAHRQMPLA